MKDIRLHLVGNCKLLAPFSPIHILSNCTIYQTNVHLQRVPGAWCRAAQGKPDLGFVWEECVEGDHQDRGQGDGNHDQDGGDWSVVRGQDIRDREPGQSAEEAADGDWSHGGV